MTSPSLAEEFPAQTEAPDFTHQKVGSLALVQSVDRIPQQRVDLDAPTAETEEDVIFVYERKPQIGAEEAGYVMYRGSLLGRIAAGEKKLAVLKQVAVEKGIPASTEQTKSLRKSIHEHKKQLNEIDKEWEAGEFVQFPFYPHHKGEMPLNPRTRSFMRTLLKGHDIPKTMTQLDAEMFTEAVLGSIQKSTPRVSIVQNDLPEIVRLRIRGKSSVEIAEHLGNPQGKNALEVRRSHAIKALHERGYPPIVLNYLLTKFLAAEEPEVGLDTSAPIPQQRAYKPRKSRTNPASELLDDADTAEEQIETKNDDLDAEAPTTDIVRSYLTEIGKVPLLTAEQEVQLAKQIDDCRPAMEILKLIKEEGLRVAPEVKEILSEDALPGMRAANRMLEANLRLGVHWAKRYQGKGLELLDLIQEANLGLVRGVEKFDYTKGYKFSTYGSWWVRQALQRAVADKGSAVRIPVHMHDKIKSTLKVKTQLEDELERRATFEEIAAVTGDEPDKVQEILGYGRPLVYLDQKIGDDKEATLGDFIPDKSQKDAIEIVAAEMRERDIDTVLKSLPERSAAVLRMRFGIDDGNPKTLDEVGKELGLTRERIRQIERDTLKDLRKDSAALMKLKDYVA